MKNCKIPWDKENSRYILVIYFFNAQGRQCRQDFYSKIVGKPEPATAFEDLRAKAHRWRTFFKEPYCYGYSSALIYDNLNPYRGKPALIKINTDGVEMTHGRNVIK